MVAWHRPRLLPFSATLRLARRERRALACLAMLLLLALAVGELAAFDRLQPVQTSDLVLLAYAACLSLLPYVMHRPPVAALGLLLVLAVLFLGCLLHTATAFALLQPAFITGAIAIAVTIEGLWANNSNVVACVAVFTAAHSTAVDLGLLRM